MLLQVLTNTNQPSLLMGRELLDFGKMLQSRICRKVCSYRLLRSASIIAREDVREVAQDGVPFRWFKVRLFTHHRSINRTAYHICTRPCT